MKKTIIIALSAEGQTEKCYFEWLQRQINADSTAKYHIKINCKVNQSPSSSAKMLPPFASEYCILAHICDVESKEKEHVDKFHNVIVALEDAKHRFPNYKLYYSNFSFELWMILHKMECGTSLTDRKKYLSKINQAYRKEFKSLDAYKEAKGFSSCLACLTLEDVKHAVQRAQKLCTIYKANQKKFVCYKKVTYAEDNPYLTVGELVGNILNCCY